MLDELRVSNLGIIAEADLQLRPGMVVVSGETGAGKTLMLGALRLLIGSPARSSLIGPGDDHTEVEGRFFLDGEEVVASRTIHPSGSRAYLDGRLAPAKSLVERFAGVVEVVGQHDPVSLTRPKVVRRLIDRRLESNACLREYRHAWEAHAEVVNTKTVLGADRRTVEREIDLLLYQVSEIDEADFQLGEEETLNQEALRLGHAEEVSNMLAEARLDLDRARDLVGPAVDAVRQARQLDHSQEGLANLLDDLEATFAEALSMTREAWESVEADPEELARINERRSILGDLKRKYGSSIAEIHEYRSGARARLGELRALLDRSRHIADEQNAAAERLGKVGGMLRRLRRVAAEQIALETTEHLRQLGFGDPVVRIEVKEATPGVFGADQINLQFASDSRLPPGPVGKIASGGELSRLVLSLRLASGIGAVPIIAFDEVDAGVGGSTALAMGSKLARVSKDRQAICISHLPQVAAYADTHLVVERKGPVATVRELSDDSRLIELSRMLSGMTESSPGRDHARELRAMAIADRVGS